MKPEKRHLIHDVLGEEHDARREATLLAGGRILRWRRWQRRAIQTLATVTILGVTAISLPRMIAPRPPALVAVPAIPVPAPSLTDAELLALFPDTPIGLATLENGRKKLIFPRPGDEERFVTRL
jgi:hypothetical protein